MRPARHTPQIFANFSSQVCFSLKRLSNICSGCFESKIEKLSKLSEPLGGNFEAKTQTTLIKNNQDYSTKAFMKLVFNIYSIAL